MDNEKDSKNFIADIINEISKKDRLHSKKINENIQYITEHYPEQFHQLLSLVYAYFNNIHVPADKVAGDYLKMINDMRREGLYFYKTGKYRCENQSIAYEKVYSNKEVMSYYMNALLISQLLWKHHFELFIRFEEKLKTLFDKNAALKILDVGPGHGFFSFIVKKHFTKYKSIDIVDISETSLQMTKSIIGLDNNKINYTLKDIFEYDDAHKYDLILLGEVIEHLDKPKDILIKLSKLLNTNGVLWVTTPTNSPALDHVYLFNTKEEVIKLMQDSGLKVIDSCNFFAEDMDEEKAIKQRVTNLVGLFCKNTSL
jgi:2-polyprenyl-3-methyl-5-hydroxy-6-metoxy-1,4-benzoquinol methylase